MGKKIFIIIFLFVILILVVAVAVVNWPKFQATLYVDPQTISQPVGQDFTIGINVSNIGDLFGWQLRLKWNATVLDAINITEGSFLKQGVETLFVSKTNNTAGYIIIDCTLLGELSGVSGSGQLATIKFHVKTGGACYLDLYDTILLSSSEQTITYTVRDGYFST